MQVLSGWWHSSYDTPEEPLTDFIFEDPGLKDAPNTPSQICRHCRVGDMITLAWPHLVNGLPCKREEAMGEEGADEGRCNPHQGKVAGDVPRLRTCVCVREVG